MVQIIKAPSFGTELGQAFGGGLGSGLQNLLQQHKTAAALQSLGIAPDLASQLSALDPASLREVVKGKIQEPSNAAFQQAISRIMGGGAPQQMAPQDQMGMQPGMEGQQGLSSIPTAGLKPQQALQLVQLQTQREALDIKRQAAIEQSNAPFTKDFNVQVDSAKKIDRTIDRAVEVLDKVRLTGPLGNLPAISPAAQELDSLLSELLLQKSTMEVKGQRATNLYLALQQASKPHRGMYKETLKKRLLDLKRESDKVLTKDKVRDQIVEANRGFEPRNLKGEIKNVKSLHKRLVDESVKRGVPPEGTIVEDKGYHFKFDGNDWIFVGR